MCMYARAARGGPWPDCRYRMISSTPASIAVDRPPFLALTPEKRSGAAPAMKAMRLTALLAIWGEQVMAVATETLPGPLRRRGNKGGQEGQRAAGNRRLEQAG